MFEEQGFSNKTLFSLEERCEERNTWHMDLEQTIYDYQERWPKGLSVVTINDDVYIDDIHGCLITINFLL